MAKKCCDDSGSLEASSSSVGSFTYDDPINVPGPHHNACAQPQCITPQGCVPSNLQGCLYPSPCSCNRCVQAGCCAPSPLQGSTPYYQAVSMCAEDNKKKVVLVLKSQTFKLRYASAMPQCSVSVNMNFDPFTEVPTGAWVWANGIGVLRVVSGNPCAGTLELENICPQNCSGQAAPGTPIPACTLFILGIPQCGLSSSGGDTTFPFLNSGFVAPDYGECIDIAVTNVNGLSVNKAISINGGIYRISEIISSTLITICNDGEGLTPGTVVNYQDADGNLIVPIIVVDSDPCTNTEVLAGKPLVCTGGATAPLIGTENGQVLVWDEDSGNSVYRTLGIPVLDCTTLTACLTLDPDLPPDTAYLVLVASTADFTVGDIVTIGGVEFEVTEIVNATQMRIVPLSPPAVIQTFNAGATLCSADCCTILEARLDDIDASANFDDAAPIGAPVTIDAGDPEVIGNEAVLTVTNNSTAYSMGFIIVWDYVWLYRLEGVGGELQEFIRRAFYVVDPNPLAPVAQVYEHQDCREFLVVPGSGTPGQNPLSHAASFSESVSVAAGDSITFKGSCGMVFGAGDAPSIEVHELSTRLSYLGVAVRV